VLREPLLGYLREIAMNPDQLPETRAARRFRKFFEDQGKAEGKREGKAEGKREALLTMLAARRMSPSAEEGEVIAACNDAAILDQWIVRAMTAASVAEVLNAPGAAF
jgi:predicted transposase YdaD